MKTLPNAELRKLLLKRFKRAFELGPAGDEIVEHEETRGRKSAFWHQRAVEYAKHREAEGVSRNQSCREFQQLLATEFNYYIAVGTVIDVVRSRYGRPFRGIASEKFAYFVLQNDLDEAIKWFKRLSPKERRRWGFE